MNDLHTDPFEQRLRHDLRVMAGTVTGAPAARVGIPPKRRRRRLIAAGVLGAAVLAPAAATGLNSGPEYVDTISPERIVTEGSVGGSRYLLVESDRTDECGNPVKGVELIDEQKNLFGVEWNTTGYEYGESVEKDCGFVYDATRYLKNPALLDDSGAAVGDSFVWVYSVHPDVTTVRITADDYTEDLTVYAVDGAGYAPFEIPEELTSYTSELLIDGQVVPGSSELQQVPDL